MLAISGNFFEVDRWRPNTSRETPISSVSIGTEVGVLLEWGIKRAAEKILRPSINISELVFDLGSKELHESVEFVMQCFHGLGIGGLLAFHGGYDDAMAGSDFFEIGLLVG